MKKFKQQCVLCGKEIRILGENRCQQHKVKTLYDGTNTELHKIWEETGKLWDNNRITIKVRRTMSLLRKSREWNPLQRTHYE